MDVPQLSRPAHVLVVDDDPTNRLVARKLCQLFGATVETADCGDQAITLCATGIFDLVLMDIRMPLMDGVETSYGIRSLPGPAGHVPIIAVTGDTGADLKALCFAAGMSALVEKPIMMTRLFEAIEDAVQTSGTAATQLERSETA